MNDNARRRGDRLGRLLDPWRSATEAAEMAEAAARLQRLYDRQRAEPDEQFVRRLERTLMSTTSTARPPVTGQGQAPGEMGRRLGVAEQGRRGGAVDRPRASRVASVASSALLLLIVAAVAFVTVRSRSPEGSGPGGFLAPGREPTAAAAPSPAAPASDVAWELAPPALQAANFGPIAVANGMAYRLITAEALLPSESVEGVQAIKTDEGSVAWTFATSWSRRVILADAAGAYLVSDPETVVAVGRDSGGVRWSVPFVQPVVSMALADGVLYVWDESSTMTALDASGGEIVWQTTTDDRAGEPSALAGKGEPELRPAVGERVVVMISAGGILHAFDRGSGEVVWSTPGFNQLGSWMTVTDDVLFVLALQLPAAVNEATVLPDHRGLGISLTDGSVEWEIRVAGPFTPPVAPGGTGQIHLVADRVERVGEEEGAVSRTPIVDSTAANGAWPTPTTVAEDGSSPPRGGAYVYGIDAHTGEAVWMRSSQAGGGFELLATSPRSSEAVWAVTSDGQVATLAGEYGGLLGVPENLGRSVVSLVVGSGEDGAVALLRGGTLVAFDQRPPGEQG